MYSLGWPLVKVTFFASKRILNVFIALMVSLRFSRQIPSTLYIYGFRRNNEKNIADLYLEDSVLIDNIDEPQSSVITIPTETMPSYHSTANVSWRNCRKRRIPFMIGYSFFKIIRILKGKFGVEEITWTSLVRFYNIAS